MKLRASYATPVDSYLLNEDKLLTEGMRRQQNQSHSPSTDPKKSFMSISSKSSAPATPSRDGFRSPSVSEKQGMTTDREKNDIENLDRAGRAPLTNEKLASSLSGTVLGIAMPAAASAASAGATSGTDSAHSKSPSHAQYHHYQQQHDLGQSKHSDGVQENQRKKVCFCACVHVVCF